MMKMPLPFKRKSNRQPPTIAEELRSWVDLLADDPSVDVWTTKEGEIYATRTGENGYRHYVDTSAGKLA